MLETHIFRTVARTRSSALMWDSSRLALPASGACWGCGLEVRSLGRPVCMDSESAWTVSGPEHARRLALLFGRTAEVMERSAVLAEEHAERCTQSGRLDAAAREREAAEQAREGASQARSRAASQEELFRELDELERRADERDRVADERDRHADERERLADDRERAADERTRIADECEARLQEDRALGSTGPRHQSREALRQANDALERA